MVSRPLQFKPRNVFIVSFVDVNQIYILSHTQVPAMCMMRVLYRTVRGTNFDSSDVVTLKYEFCSFFYSS